MLELIHSIADHMSFDSIVGVAGLFLAIWSLIQAKSAERIAKEAKDEVQKYRKTSDLSRLSGFLEVAIQEIRVYGPATSGQRLLGLDHNRVAERVQGFVLELRGCLDRFKAGEIRKAKLLCDEITALLNEFTAEGKTSDELKRIGQDILHKLSRFNSDLKSSLNNQIEKV